MMSFTLCAATSSGNPHNNHYPNHHHSTDQADLQLVARLDHVAATYTGDQRSSASFVSSDCVVMDIDNDHADNPTDGTITFTFRDGSSRQRLIGKLRSHYSAVELSNLR